MIWRLLPISAIVLARGLKDDPINGLFVYDEDEARMFASLAQATYCDEAGQVLDWSCDSCKQSRTPLVPGKIRIIDGGEWNASRVLVGKLRDQPGCVMAFRGTVYPHNWLKNLEYFRVQPQAYGHCDGCKVHMGFHSVWKALENASLNALKDFGCTSDSNQSAVYLTGHSMGGAIANLAMFTLKARGFDIRQSYTFEAPRVGNAAFVAEFFRRFSREIPVFRVTHARDPVVHLPGALMGYQHVDREIFYEGNATTYRVCDKGEDPRCAGQYWNVLKMIMMHDSRADHCRIGLVPNGNICGPPNCGWRASRAFSQSDTPREMVV